MPAILSPERERRREHYRLAIFGTSRRHPVEESRRVQDMFCAIVKDPIGDRVPGETPIIRAADLPDAKREQLEDLYDVLAEKCLTSLLYAAWTALEKSLQRR